MSPVIAAVKDVDGMKKCFESECQTVFVLYGTICNIGGIVREIKKHGKYAMVHADFTQGLGAKEIAVDFIRENTLADGVISTKPQLVKRCLLYTSNLWMKGRMLFLFPCLSPGSRAPDYKASGLQIRMKIYTMCEGTDRWGGAEIFSVPP